LPDIGERRCPFESASRRKDCDLFGMRACRPRWDRNWSCRLRDSADCLLMHTRED
jgi:hypothetical protein